MAAQSFIAPTNAFDRRTLGKFEVLCRLSTGGMSEIYLAHQRGLGGFRKLVVIKTILPDIGGEEDFVRMFLDEARTTAAFAHPNIAQVYELDVDDGQLFMAMEFVQGCTLVEMARACRQAKEPIPIGFTMAAVRDTALALHYAHNFTDARGRKQLVVHRDVAEKNIMVTYEGVTKLLDFGIAKAQGRSNRTSVGMVKGTSGYMSPEQIRGEPLDGRSDVFSLGVVLHECLTGMRLFHGKTPEEGMLAALNQNVNPPSKLNPRVWSELDAVVLKALSRQRDERFATALEFARAIERVSRGETWLPEQGGELVNRFFAERRAETSRLLDRMIIEASTGELRLDTLMAQVRASAPRSNDTPMAATPPPPRASIATPGGERKADISTSPARPKVIPATPPVPPPKPPPPVEMAPDVGPVPASRAARTDFTDEESDAKTIPESSLPQELKLLRQKHKLQRESAAGASAPPPTVPPPEPVTDESAPSNAVKEAPTANPNILIDSSITQDSSVKTALPGVDQLVPPSGGSVTRQIELSSFEDEEDEQATVMAGHEDMRGARNARRPSRDASENSAIERTSPVMVGLVALVVGAMVALLVGIWLKVFQG